MNLDALPARIFDKILFDPMSGCWLWTAALQDGGYGYVTFGGRTRVAHRVIYELLLVPIPRGLQLDHLCRVRHCVNPEHVEPVAQRVNLLRGETLPAANVLKTHCPRGHAYDVANTAMSGGSRVCRACGRLSKRVTHSEPDTPCTECGAWFVGQQGLMVHARQLHQKAAS